MSRGAARRKLLTREQAARRVGAARRRGETVVFTSGCFDHLHLGHLRGLEQARDLGDRLVVGINGDASVRRLKGPGRPIVPARERAELLAGLACVDWVLRFGEATPRRTLALLRPDVYAKGGDWSLETLVAEDVPPGLELRVERLRELRGIHTTLITERVRRGRSGAPRRRRG